MEKQSWGGYYLTLDLEKRPWETEPQLLVDTWKPAMDHLSETGAFLQQYVEKGKLCMRKGNSQIPPREVENWSN